jgi:type IX secretion system PorP/SprF family membrane protein
MQIKTFSYFPLCVFFFCLSFSLKAQDPHFSQSWLAPLQMNPALAATSKWDTRIGGQWKEQWSSVPVSYRTFSAFYDQKLHQLKLPAGKLGVGGVLMYDQAGDGKLSWTQIGLRVSYVLPLTDVHQISAGAGFDFGQRAFLPEQLQFGDQYNGEFFDPNQNTSEQFGQQSSGLGSLVAGLNYQAQDPRSRSELNTGLAASHLNGPELTFYNTSGIKVPIWARFYAFGQLELNEDWDVTAVHHFFRQGAYQEILLGAGARYHLPYKGSDLGLGAGLNYRFQDALILNLEARYQQWLFGLSYDINTSGFQTATNGRGGLELALHYYLMQARPPEEFKSCPIF